VARRQAINPFYPLLVISGAAFAITASAYGVMALKAMTPSAVDQGHPLLVFLDRRGMPLMAVELAVLAISTFLAMGTDNYWSPAKPADITTADSPAAAEPASRD
jgi:hypothetical protein